jgi:predicted transcriptional regulator
MTKLGDLERKVMEVLWDSMGIPLTGRQVATLLPDRAYTTVLTILERLRHKDLVVRSGEGRVHSFAASESRETYMAELMIEAMGGSSDRNAVLARFAQSVSASEAVALRQALVDLGGDSDGASK